MKFNIILAIVFIKSTFLFSQESGYFTDKRDGQVYKTVKIGNQLWMAENFALKTSSGSWVYGGKETNAIKYGRLYNFETAKKAAPNGWYLPSDNEWQLLELELGLTYKEVISEGREIEESSNRGDKISSDLKSVSGWHKNGNGTNSSGFNVKPGGIKNVHENFFREGFSAYFWTSTDYFTTPNLHRIYIRRIKYNFYSGVFRFTDYFNYDYSFQNTALSVRYIKD